MPALLDLPLSPGVRYLHTGGEPLGESDPRWPPFIDWLAALGVQLVKVGCSGHATADDLHRMVSEIAPRVVFPVHGTHPEALVPPAGTRAVLPALGVAYDLDDMLG
jgi:ribonuclease J